MGHVIHRSQDKSIIYISCVIDQHVNGVCTGSGVRCRRAECCEQAHTLLRQEKPADGRHCVETSSQYANVQNAQNRLTGGAVVKGAVLQRQLCHQRLWVRTQALSQPAVTGRSVGRRTNWPSVVRVREGLVGRDILVSSRTSDSCGGSGAVRANQGCQVHGVSSDTLVRLASGLDGAVLRSIVAWLGCVSEDA